MIARIAPTSLGGLGQVVEGRAPLDGNCPFEGEESQADSAQDGLDGRPQTREGGRMDAMPFVIQSKGAEARG